MNLKPGEIYDRGIEGEVYWEMEEFPSNPSSQFSYGKEFIGRFYFHRILIGCCNVKFPLPFYYPIYSEFIKQNIRDSIVEEIKTIANMVNDEILQYQINPKHIINMVTSPNQLIRDLAKKIHSKEIRIPVYKGVGYYAIPKLD